MAKKNIVSRTIRHGGTDYLSLSGFRIGFFCSVGGGGERNDTGLKIRNGNAAWLEFRKKCVYIYCVLPTVAMCSWNSHVLSDSQPMNVEHFSLPSPFSCAYALRHWDNGLGKAPGFERQHIKPTVRQPIRQLKRSSRAETLPNNYSSFSPLFLTFKFIKWSGRLVTGKFSRPQNLQISVHSEYPPSTCAVCLSLQVHLCPGVHWASFAVGSKVLWMR